jgi:hypothetical protein
VPVVEEQTAEQLVVEVPHPGEQECGGVGGAADRFAYDDGGGEVAPCQFGQCRQHRRTGRPDAALRAQRPCRRVQQSPQAAELAQQVFGQ